MGEIVRMDNGKDNEIMAIMNDASLCPLLEETKVGVSNYTKLPVTRLAALDNCCANRSNRSWWKWIVLC